MTQSQKWEVFFHDEFDPEFDAFSKDVQDELLAVAVAVRELGPAADHPHAEATQPAKVQTKSSKGKK
ncbi:hypothetical protein [Duganella violaceipulchra]|uniref:Uncharacterized protein n=1 Tax=Duganella violaceipulchra TaxID=2849652 RepID=A0AA41HBB4_9BURK|nr:hypothetical protein [Duganella violaceicalia]MBV6322970.1 hypothetical protein [Duganella violaceicalia]MCP2008051.1 hypothetical protein [Duganella violaceicalia]